MICERYRGILFEIGWRDEIFDLLSTEQRNILVLYDKMGVASSSTSVVDFFTKGSHDSNLTVIYLVQNVYNHGLKPEDNITKQTTVWSFVTVGTRRISAPWRIKYVQITVSGLLILLQMPPPNLMGT